MQTEHISEMATSCHLGFVNRKPISSKSIVNIVYFRLTGATPITIVYRTNGGTVTGAAEKCAGES